MLEKRKVRRRNSFYYLEVFEEETKNFVGRLINITTDGIMLESEEPIEVKKGYRLSMELPNSFVWMPKIIFDAKVFGVERKAILKNTRQGFNSKTWIQKFKNKSTD